MRRLRRDGKRPLDAEAAIAHLPVERACFFARDGTQVARFEGEESWLFYDLSAPERARVRGGLLVHNHPPRRQFPSDDPRYDSASFSPADWRAAADLNLAELVLISPSWRYTLSRPERGWYPEDWTEIDFMDLLIELWNYLEREDRRRATVGSPTAILAEATRSHRVNEQFATEIGARYGRESR